MRDHGVFGAFLFPYDKCNHKERNQSVVVIEHMRSSRDEYILHTEGQPNYIIGELYLPERAAILYA
jgi:hypothetical protein